MFASSENISSCQSFSLKKHVEGNLFNSMHSQPTENDCFSNRVRNVHIEDYKAMIPRLALSREAKLSRMTIQNKHKLEFYYDVSHSSTFSRHKKCIIISVIYFLRFM